MATAARRSALVDVTGLPVVRRMTATSSRNLLASVIRADLERLAQSLEQNVRNRPGDHVGGIGR
jgi:hypothetical protein